MTILGMMELETILVGKYRNERITQLLQNVAKETITKRKIYGMGETDLGQ